MNDQLCIAKTWIKLNKGKPIAAGTTASELNGDCWNCGKPRHHATDCKEARDPVTYNKSRKKFIEARGLSSSLGPCWTQSSNNKDKDGSDYQRKRWETAGLSLVNGILVVNCKSCGYNPTHSTISIILHGSRTRALSV
jgi:hypothetical protein